MEKKDKQKKKGTLLTVVCVIVLISLIYSFFNPDAAEEAKKNIPDTTTTDTPDTGEKKTDKKTDEEQALDDLGISKDQSLSEVVPILNDAGYAATYTYQGEDFTDLIPMYPEEDLKDYVIKKIDDIDTKGKSVAITLEALSNIKQNKAEKTLESKLSKGKALVALKHYGEQEYPYGFKLHSFTGLIEASAEDENTWFLKVSCDVTNEYNATAEMTCEGKVTGTEDAPEVTFFDIY